MYENHVLSALESGREFKPPDPQSGPVVVYKHQWIKDKIYPDNKPYILDGKGRLVFMDGFDIQDCHNWEIRNCWIFGGIKLDDSNPNIGLKNVTIRNCKILKSPSRGIFMGGANINGINILNCDILYTQGIFNTHGIYLTGAHWEGDVWGPCKNIKVIGNRIGYNPGGRNGIQLNGRFHDVEISDNLIFHFQNDAIELIGVQKCTVSGNIAYGGNRGKGLVCHDYFWTGWDPELFFKYHQPCRDIWVGKNTFVVGPHQYSWDQWHKGDGSDPTKGHCVVEVTNSCQHEHPEVDFSNRNIIFQQNLLWTPNAEILKFGWDQEAKATSFLNNMIACANPKDPFIDHINLLAQFKKGYLADPETVFPGGLPEYPDSIDLDNNPNYDFMKHSSHFNPFSGIAMEKECGKPIDDATTSAFEHPYLKLPQ